MTSSGQIFAASLLFLSVIGVLALLVTLFEERAAAEESRLTQLRDHNKVTLRNTTPNSGNWALLVAGSKSFENYRHQADVAHAYHLIRENGFPEQNIVTMLYDDVANDSRNPRPGTLYNDESLRNYYQGLVIDYRGEEVNADNFLRVLEGKGSGKVIRSGPDDNIFMFYADHGGVAILGMPVGRLVTRSDLIRVLKAKKAANGYRKLVVYLEACEGGSMFSDFPNDLDVYAVTAANAFESSYAVLCSQVLPCLSDEFSLNWMSDSEMNGIFGRPLHEQFKNTRERTVASHVSEYGNFGISNDEIADFQGFVKGKSSLKKSWRRPSNSVLSNRTYKKVRIYDVPLEIARRNRTRIIEMEQKREELIEVIREIVRSVVEKSKSLRIVDFFIRRERKRPHHLCISLALQRFDEKCAPFSENPFAFMYSFVIANLCEATRRSAPIVGAIDSICGGKTLVGVV